MSWLRWLAGQPLAQVQENEKFKSVRLGYARLPPSLLKLQLSNGAMRIRTGHAEVREQNMHIQAARGRRFRLSCAQTRTEWMAAGWGTREGRDPAVCAQTEPHEREQGGGIMKGGQRRPRMRQPPQSALLTLPRRARTGKLKGIKTGSILVASNYIGDAEFVGRSTSTLGGHAQSLALSTPTLRTLFLVGTERVLFAFSTSVPLLPARTAEDRLRAAVHKMVEVALEAGVRLLRGSSTTTSQEAERQ